MINLFEHIGAECTTHSNKIGTLELNNGFDEFPFKIVYRDGSFDTFTANGRFFQLRVSYNDIRSVNGVELENTGLHVAPEKKKTKKILWVDPVNKTVGWDDVLPRTINCVVLKEKAKKKDFDLIRNYITITKG